MPNQKYPRGSEWRKWDLHVHTPASLVHSYPGPDPWEFFFRELEDLPAEFKVIGINDYIFIDGYKRMLAAKKEGRLANIDLLLPVIELRLDKFGGTAGHLSRINYHVIFSNEIEPDVIEQQFLNALSSKYVLSPEYDHLRTGGQWAAIPTRKSLEDLGEKIISSVPVDKRSDFGSPLIEGFNNLCISIDAIQTPLRSHYFAGKHLTAVGKTEWADIKWNDSSIAEKKSIINGADLVFISAENAAACSRTKKALLDARVNSRLLDCSDAHSPSSSKNKDRIGKCFTWIKADPTFQGLLQIMHEPNWRIYLGDQPPHLGRVNENATRYMSSILFNRTEQAKSDETWFSGEVPLNYGLVAIIGRKGSGKSALAEILALLGNTRVSKEHFSFLTKQRFLEPRAMLGSMFQGTVTWHSGSEVSRLLAGNVDTVAPELVKYVPQNFLETICSDLKDLRESQFYVELMEVIFSHVSEAERLGQSTLKDVIEFLTNEKQELISQLMVDLSETNRQIVVLEEKTTEEYRQGLMGQLRQRLEELKVHDLAKPSEKKEPSQDVVGKENIENVKKELAELVRQTEALDVQIADAREEMRKTVLIIAAADRLISRMANLERLVKTFQIESVEDARILNIELKTLVTIDMNREAIAEVKEDAFRRSQATVLSLDIEKPDSLTARRHGLSVKTEETRSRLDEPNRRYQEYLHQVSNWKKRRSEIEGSAEVQNTVEGLRSQLEALGGLQKKIRDLEESRISKAREIFAAKEDLLVAYRKLYSSVQNYIDRHPVSQQQGALQFSASMAIEGLVDGLLGRIHQGRKGSFQGEEEGRERLHDIIAKSDFTKMEGVEAFISCIKDHLEHDKRENSEKPVRLRDQLIQNILPEKVYDYLYGLEYLNPRFELRWRDKPLFQLSPGERGNLLLVFYLLLDNRDIPLIIDQPEENLDNQTIATMLVPAIKYAKMRRQIFIVTHNPNLAVVCDGDQIIHASLDKTDGNRVVYTTGSIEDPYITQLIVDVLEGTKPAFDLRDAKYEILEHSP